MRATSDSPRSFQPRPGLAAALALAAGLAVAFAAGPARAQAVTRNLTLMSHVNEWPPSSPGESKYSACWSYIHGDGREYAILGTSIGTAIYNVTDPANPHRVGFIDGPPSVWREMKSYRNWIYIVTEGAGEGIQIVSMANPEAPVKVGNYLTGFARSHTVAVDTARALLICNGTNDSSNNLSGMRILSIANPVAPAQLAVWPAGGPYDANTYVHDCAPVGTRLYASSIYAGIERIFDLTNPSAPVQLNAWSYSGAFSHNSWPSADGNTLYITDELSGQPLKIFDISSVVSPVLENGITSNPHAIVHNAHVMGNELYLSNYTEGIRILDILDPRHPAEFASADSWPGVSGGFFGVWEVCPYFPSGTVIASDMQSGLYVYRPVRDYGVIRAKVEYPGGSPASGVDVYLTTQGDSLETPADGIVQFAPNPGTHTVLAHEFGYDDASATRLVSAGLRDTVTLTLVPKPSRPWSGKVRDANTLATLEDAEVDLEYTHVHDHSNASGTYDLGLIPEDTYQVSVRRPGYIPIEALMTVDYDFLGEDFRMVPAADYDALEVASNWVVGAPGDGASSGIWTRVEPLGTGLNLPDPTRMRRAPALDALRDRRPWLDHEGHEEDGAIPGEVQSEYDRTPPPGTLCFITGQGTMPSNIGQADVDGGRTSLTTRLFDMTGMSQPTFAYWRWFYAAGQSDDYFKVMVSNDDGSNWTPVSVLPGGFYNDWEEVSIHVSDYVTPTASMRFRFVVCDSSPATVVEAGVDDAMVYDAATALVGLPHGGAPSALALGRARPNPGRGEIAVELALSSAGPVDVAVFDLNGRRVRTIARGLEPAGTRTLRWDGRDERGGAASAGLYFMRARAGEATAEIKLVRVR